MLLVAFAALLPRSVVRADGGYTLDCGAGDIAGAKSCLQDKVATRTALIKAGCACDDPGEDGKLAFMNKMPLSDDAKAKGNALLATLNKRCDCAGCEKSLPGVYFDLFGPAISTFGADDPTEEWKLGDLKRAFKPDQNPMAQLDAPLADDINRVCKTASGDATKSESMAKRVEAFKTGTQLDLNLDVLNCWRQYSSLYYTFPKTGAVFSCADLQSGKFGMDTSEGSTFRSSYFILNRGCCVSRPKDINESDCLSNAMANIKGQVGRFTAKVDAGFSSYFRTTIVTRSCNVETAFPELRKAIQANYDDVITSKKFLQTDGRESKYIKIGDATVEWPSFMTYLTRAQIQDNNVKEAYGDPAKGKPNKGNSGGANGGTDPTNPNPPPPPAPQEPEGTGAGGSGGTDQLSTAKITPKLVTQGSPGGESAGCKTTDIDCVTNYYKGKQKLFSDATGCGCSFPTQEQFDAATKSMTAFPKSDAWKQLSSPCDRIKCASASCTAALGQEYTDATTQAAAPFQGGGNPLQSLNPVIADDIKAKCEAKIGKLPDPAPSDSSALIGNMKLQMTCWRDQLSILRVRASYVQKINITPDNVLNGLKDDFPGLQGQLSTSCATAARPAGVSSNGCLLGAFANIQSQVKQARDSVSWNGVQPLQDSEFLTAGSACGMTPELKAKRDLFAKKISSDLYPGLKSTTGKGGSLIPTTDAYANVEVRPMPRSFGGTAPKLGDPAKPAGAFTADPNATGGSNQGIGAGGAGGAAGGAAGSNGSSSSGAIGNGGGSGQGPGGTDQGGGGTGENGSKYGKKDGGGGKNLGVDLHGSGDGSSGYPSGLRNCVQNLGLCVQQYQITKSCKDGNCQNSDVKKILASMNDWNDVAKLLGDPASPDYAIRDYFDQLRKEAIDRTAEGYRKTTGHALWEDLAKDKPDSISNEGIMDACEWKETSADQQRLIAKGLSPKKHSEFVKENMKFLGVDEKAFGDKLKDKEHLKALAMSAMDLYRNYARSSYLGIGHDLVDPDCPCRTGEYDQDKEPSASAIINDYPNSCTAACRGDAGPKNPWKGQSDSEGWKGKYALPVGTPYRAKPGEPEETDPMKMPSQGLCNYGMASSSPVKGGCYRQGPSLIDRQLESAPGVTAWRDQAKAGIREDIRRFPLLIAGSQFKDGNAFGELKYDSNDKEMGLAKTNAKSFAKNYEYASKIVDLLRAETGNTGAKFIKPGELSDAKLQAAIDKNIDKLAAIAEDARKKLAVDFGQTIKKFCRDDDDTGISWRTLIYHDDIVKTVVRDNPKFQIVQTCAANEVGFDETAKKVASGAFNVGCVALSFASLGVAGPACAFMMTGLAALEYSHSLKDRDQAMVCGSPGGALGCGPDKLAAAQGNAEDKKWELVMAGAFGLFEGAAVAAKGARVLSELGSAPKWLTKTEMEAMEAEIKGLRGLEEGKRLEKLNEIGKKYEDLLGTHRASRKALEKALAESKLAAGAKPGAFGDAIKAKYFETAPGAKLDAQVEKDLAELEAKAKASGKTDKEIAEMTDKAMAGCTK